MLKNKENSHPTKEPSMPLDTNQEVKTQKLIAQLRATFGGGEFDTSRIMLVAEYDSPQLMAVLEDTIPSCRKQRQRGGPYLRHTVIKRALVKLAKQHFTTDKYGWWRLKPVATQARSPMEHGNVEN
jgi:hypothetical protein